MLVAVTALVSVMETPLVIVLFFLLFLFFFPLFILIDLVFEVGLMWAWAGKRGRGRRRGMYRFDIHT